MYETTPPALAGEKAAGPFTLPELPFQPDALAPIISREALELHHGRHHQAYVDKLNELVGDSELAHLPLDELVRRTAGKGKLQQVFDNAGQAWNHHFFWRSLSPLGGPPTERLRALVDRDFGGYDAFREAFAKAATAQFGSGWAWLVADGDRLSIQTTSNADSPIARGSGTPLLALDVWEHAYYVDYRNRRDEYARAVVGKLLNWEFAEQNLAR